MDKQAFYMGICVEGGDSAQTPSWRAIRQNHRAIQIICVRGDVRSAYCSVIIGSITPFISNHSQLSNLGRRKPTWQNEGAFVIFPFVVSICLVLVTALTSLRDFFSAQIVEVSIVGG